MLKFIKYHFIIFIIMVPLWYSCAYSRPIQGVPLTSKELETMEIVGFVETGFEALNGFKERDLLKKGYYKLMAAAREQYNEKTEKISIRNVVIKKRMSGKNWLIISGRFNIDYYINVAAKGVVIKTKESPVQI